MTSLETGRAVGGLVEAIGWGETAELLVDPLLRQDLGVGEGTSIEVAAMSPGAADEVCLQLVTGSVTEEEAAHACRAQLKHQSLATGQTKFLSGPNGTQIVLRVLEVRPQELAVYGETSRTRVLAATTTDGVSPYRLSALGQFHGPAVRSLERIIHAHRNAKTCRQLGVPLPQCVLISGARGSGRLSLAQALAAELQRSTVVIDAYTLLALAPWQLAGTIGARFRAARDSGAVLVIRDLEVLAKATRDAVPNHDRIALAALAVELARRDVLVVCTSGAGREGIAEALRFDLEVAIPALDRRARQALLEQFVATLPLGPVDLDTLASRTSGWHAGDLERWCHEAARLAIARADGRLQDLAVSQEDFDAARGVVCPQALRGDPVDRANTTWEDLGGIDGAKAQLREAMRILIDPEPFAEFGIRSPRGILLHGAPGCGKTALARVLAASSGLPFIAASASSLLSKWFGDSEARVRDLFQNARQMAPCIVFVDELESVGERRGQAGNEAADRLLAELLVQMDGLAARDGVLVLAATNRKDLVDEALLRPGRFDELIEIPMPDAADRAAILAVHLRGKPLAEALDLGALANRCAGLSGADLAEVVRRAGLAALRRADFNAGEARLSGQELVAAIEDLGKARVAFRPIGFVTRVLEESHGH
ncbi:ATP-binding protein [Accumulibacter sp.]|uniref:ATP-binding protein n=2 Tax=Accumulibacter sp. TaxID=2053492 RepID=UPI0025D13638|nr:ATP-binding protein [Accumulibacter sp.]MCM8595664.1 ATP-binding protein [Accumulibacter sp.]MDS4049811.1 ATP-binding protein [Accumulibacter sp.]